MIDLEKDSNREAFESWATDKFPIAGLGQFEKHNNGTYLQRSIRNMYEAWQAAKAQAQAVPEGFVLVPVDQLNQWGRMANYAEQYGCPECFEARGYAHSLACEINEFFAIEAQEPTND